MTRLSSTDPAAVPAGDVPRLLIAPMAVAAETGGPFGRARALAVAARDQGWDVAFCAAEDPNYRPVPGVANYVAPVPSPFGTPAPVGGLLFRAALVLFRNQDFTVTSFEHALHILGATATRFFSHDVRLIRQAIRRHRPDVVFAIERPAAILAARLEDVRVLTSYSAPMAKPFAANPEYSTGVNRFLRAAGLPAVPSVLDLFDWADRKIVPSSPELESLADGKVLYVGAFRDLGPQVAPAPPARRRCIVAYTGSGAISPKRLIHTLSAAFADTGYEIYLSTKEVRPFTSGTIRVDRWFDFDTLLPQALVYIHHGGQNSVVAALLHGVPQVICPGKHYERRYNGRSVAEVHAGVSLDTTEITPPRLRDVVSDLTGDRSYALRAHSAGQRLRSLGGLPRIVRAVREVAASATARPDTGPRGVAAAVVAFPPRRRWCAPSPRVRQTGGTWMPEQVIEPEPFRDRLAHAGLPVRFTALAGTPPAT